MFSSIEITINSIAHHDDLMKQLLRKEFRLYPVDTIRQRDRSAPRIEAGYISRTYNKQPILNQIKAGPTYLRHVETFDRSAPRIDANVHLRYVERKDFLNAVLDGATSFYTSLISNIKRTGFASQAQVKANEIYVAGQKGVEIGVQKATEIAPVVANDVSNWASKTGHEAVVMAPIVAANVSNWAQTTGYDATVKATTAIASGGIQATNAIVSGGISATNAIVSGGVQATNAITSGGVQVAKMGSGLIHSVANAAVNLYASGKEKLSELQQSMHIDHNTQVLLDIKATRANLHHVRSKEIRDVSKPFLPSNYALQTTRANSLLARQVDLKSKMCRDINNKARSISLNHVVMRDCSKPIIPAKVNLVPSERSKLLQEVKVMNPSTLLHHTSTCDRSNPNLSNEKVDVFKSLHRKALLEEVKWGIELEHNALVKDRSKPLLASAPTM